MESLGKSQRATDQGNPKFALLCERLLESDQAAFAELFEIMHAALLRYSYRFTGHKEASRDIVQDAFLKVWNTRAQLDPSRSLRGLLYTIVRNLSLNHRRSARHVSDEGISDFSTYDPAPSQDDQLDSRLLEAHLKTYIEELPPRRRQAFMLSRFGGLSHKEIAETMGLTPRTVNTHIVLALRTLRSRFEALKRTRDVS